MVRQVNISEKKKAFATFLREQFNWPFHEIAIRCNISKSSVERIGKQGMKCKPLKKRSGRPPALSARDKGRFLRKFKSMREQNPNINVGLVAMECELHQLSTRALSTILNKSRFNMFGRGEKGFSLPETKKESCLCS